MLLFRLAAWLPLLHVLLAAFLFWRLPWATALGFFAIWLYLIVPLLCHLLLFGVPLDGEPLDQDSRGFKLWWFSWQLQCVFDRLTFLEEILRLVPGLYSAWLHLWGSRCSLSTFWAPGSRLYDRGLARTGPGSSIGGFATLCPHMVSPENGRLVLIVAPITLEAGAMVGGRALLSPGVYLEAGAIARAFKAYPPKMRLQSKASPDA
ncbi:MAG: hypothetical protein RL095_3726 [Verrucomicrobiota bacterium]|jgi:hypothetical protein